MQSAKVSRGQGCFAGALVYVKLCCYSRIFRGEEVDRTRTRARTIRASQDSAAISNYIALFGRLPHCMGLW